MQVYLPVDVIAAERFAADAVCRQIPVQRIPPGLGKPADIGQATVRLFGRVGWTEARNQSGLERSPLGGPLENRRPFGPGGTQLGPLGWEGPGLAPKGASIGPLIPIQLGAGGGGIPQSGKQGNSKNSRGPWARGRYPRVYLFGLPMFGGAGEGGALFSLTNWGSQVGGGGAKGETFLAPWGGYMSEGPLFGKTEGKGGGQKFKGL